MPIIKKFSALMIGCLLCIITANAQNTNWFNWKTGKTLPVKAGLSSAITGISNGVLIVAGGNNFNEPILQGGQKVINDDIYVCTNPADAQLHWIKAGKLPYPLSNTAVVQYENGLLCLGGTDGKQNYAKVFHLSWNAASRQVEIKTDYPDLPVALSDMATAKLGARIYLAGGKTIDNVAQANFWVLSKETVAGDKPAWKQLKSWPGVPRFGASLIVQNNGERNCLYLIGGKSGKTYLKDAYRFDVYITDADPWKRIADLPRPNVFAAGIAYGQSHLLIFGGSDGHDADKAIALKDSYQLVKDIMAYHTITNTWATAGNLPYGLVGTGIIKLGDKIMLVGGELRPGVRTDLIVTGSTSLLIQKSKFGIIDYATIVVYLLVLAGISFYFSRRKTNTDDYLRGGQRIPFWAAGISVMATQVSAIGFMSIPAKAFATNWSYFAGAWTWFLVVPVVTWAFIPFFRKLDVTSAYEYLERRFNESTRLFSGVIYCIYQLGRMGLVIYLPAIALSAVAPIDTVTCILIMGVLSTLYTVAGGIEAVIWIEVIQALLLMGGGVICIVLAVSGIHGGVAEFMHVAVDNQKFNLGELNFDFTSSALGVILIGNIFSRLGNLISDQAIVQRYMTTKSLKEAQKSVWTDVAVSIPWAVIVYLLGTALYVFYKNNPQLLNPAAPTDSVLPQFIAQRAPSGLSGLIIAAIFAASMATIESHIHSLATIFTTDFYMRFSKSVTEKKKLVFARWTTALLGITATCFALLLLTVNIKSILDVFTEMTGLFIGAAAGMFLLGIFTEKANSTGALTGAVSSCVILYFIKTHTEINFWLYSAIGFVCCFVIGYLCSFIFPGKKQVQGLTIYSVNEKILSK